MWNFLKDACSIKTPKKSKNKVHDLLQSNFKCFQHVQGIQNNPSLWKAHELCSLHKMQYQGAKTLNKIKMQWGGDKDHLTRGVENRDWANEENASKALVCCPEPSRKLILSHSLFIKQPLRHPLLLYTCMGSSYMTGKLSIALREIEPLWVLIKEKLVI